MEKNKLALTTCNNNANYYQWIPSAVQFWERLGFDFICHFYAEKIPRCLRRYERYIELQEPIDGFPTASVCQVARLFLPALHTNRRQILITDVDLLPLSERYFSIIEKFPSDNFVAMRKKEDTLFMGFNIASPENWRSLTKVEPEISEIRKRIMNEFRKFNAQEQFIKEPIEFYWNLDQILLNYYFRRMNPSHKIALVGEKKWAIIFSGFKKKMAYYRDKGRDVSEAWIHKNSENIIFYTRDDLRLLKNFNAEVDFLKKIYIHPTND
jgi:hypothetical protein